MYSSRLVIPDLYFLQRLLIHFVNILIHVTLCLGVDHCWSLSPVDSVDVPQVCSLIMLAIDAAFEHIKPN